MRESTESYFDELLFHFKFAIISDPLPSFPRLHTLVLEGIWLSDYRNERVLGRLLSPSTLRLCLGLDGPLDFEFLYSYLHTIAKEAKSIRVLAIYTTGTSGKSIQSNNPAVKALLPLGEMTSLEALYLPPKWTSLDVLGTISKLPKLRILHAQVYGMATKAHLNAQVSSPFSWTSDQLTGQVLAPFPKLDGLFLHLFDHSGVDAPEFVGKFPGLLGRQLDTLSLDFHRLREDTTFESIALAFPSTRTLSVKALSNNFEIDISRLWRNSTILTSLEVIGTISRYRELILEYWPNLRHLVMMLVHPDVYTLATFQEAARSVRDGHSSRYALAVLDYLAQYSENLVSLTITLGASELPLHRPKRQFRNLRFLHLLYSFLNFGSEVFDMDETAKYIISFLPEDFVAVSVGGELPGYDEYNDFQKRFKITLNNYVDAGSVKIATSEVQSSTVG